MPILQRRIQLFNYYINIKKQAEKRIGFINKKTIYKLRKKNTELPNTKPASL